jgi:small multidrug resistance pump
MAMDMQVSRPSGHVEAAGDETIAVAVKRHAWLAYLFLGGAMLSEVAATTALHRMDQEGIAAPLLGIVPSYFFAYYLMSLALKAIALGVAYALWSGCGMVLTCVLGWIAYGQALDVPALIGITLIAAGTVCINLLSKTGEA